MFQVISILTAKFHIVRHSVASVRTESKLKVGVITFSALALWVGAFFCFSEGMNWLISFGSQIENVSRGIGSIIMVRLCGVLAVVVFIMLIFSNVLVSFSTLYRSREVAYLIHSPISFRALFVARFFEIIAFSSWALAYLGSPLVLAYGLANNAPLGFYIAAAAYFVPYIALPAAIGSAITLVLVKVFPRLKLRTMVLLAMLVVSLFFLYWRESLSATRLSEDTLLPTLLDASAQTQSPYLPNHWTSRGILAASTGDYRESLFFLLLLTSNSLMALWIVTQMANFLFHPGWSGLAGQDRTRIKLPGKGFLGRLDAALKTLPNPKRALIIKDIN